MTIFSAYQGIKTARISQTELNTNTQASVTEAIANNTAKDNVTNSPISLVGRGVTTNLEDDPIGGGRGLVEKGE